MGAPSQPFLKQKSIPMINLTLHCAVLSVNKSRNRGSATIMDSTLQRVVRSAFDTVFEQSHKLFAAVTIAHVYVTVSHISFATVTMAHIF